MLTGSCLQSTACTVLPLQVIATCSHHETGHHDHLVQARLVAPAHAYLCLKGRRLRMSCKSSDGTSLIFMAIDAVNRRDDARMHGCT